MPGFFANYDSTPVILAVSFMRLALLDSQRIPRQRLSPGQLPVRFGTGHPGARRLRNRPIRRTALGGSCSPRSRAALIVRMAS